MGRERDTRAEAGPPLIDRKEVPPLDPILLRSLADPTRASSHWSEPRRGRGRRSPGSGGGPAEAFPARGPGAERAGPGGPAGHSGEAAPR